MPAPPRWLLAVPDAIRQLETLDRDLLTRRDVERLFGVSRARTAQLMRTFGAELVGASRVLRRTALLRQLRTYRQRAAFRGEEERRTRLVAALRQARLTGIRVAVPIEALEARLAGLPEGVSVEPGRIEVRFSGAQDAVGRAARVAAADRRRGARGGGAVSGVLRRADRQPAHAGGVWTDRGAVLGLVRGPRPGARGGLAAARGGLHPDPPRVGAHRQAAPGRPPHARRLARRQPGSPGEPGGGRAGAEARRHEGRDAWCSRRPRPAGSSRRSTSGTLAGSAPTVKQLVWR